MKLFSSFSLLVGSNAMDIGDLKKFLLLRQNMDQYKGGQGDPANMSNFLTQVNSINNDKRESWNQQMNPMSILMGGSSMTGIDKAQYVASMKEQMVNQMMANMNNQQFSPLLIKYAANGGAPINKEEMMFSQMEDPMATIMRLKKNGFEKGNILMKKYIAHQQFPNDPTMVQLFTGDASKDEIKKYMIAKQMENMGSAPGGDFMRTLIYRKMTGSGAADDAVSDKELMAAGMFAGKLDQNGASVKPNDAYLMFKFLKMQTKNNDGKVPASTILEIALGEDVANIQASDFEQMFGVDQQEFICLAHENNIRVPCLVNQATVNEATCPAHCCFNPRAAGTGDEMIPICYHNLLGKIGAGIARHMIKDENIEALFGSKGLPTLTDLTDAKDWAEAQMPEVLRRLNKDQGDFFGNPVGQSKWWDNTYDSDEGSFNIYASAAPSAANKKQWKPHGPTALPYDAFIPDQGEFGLGREDDNLISLDQIINAEVEQTKNRLNSDSYHCRLIPKEHMFNCFKDNYAALSSVNPEGDCAAKGCCFNEDHLFADQPVCFRSLRAGFCDPYAGHGASYAVADETANNWWKSNPKRVACGDNIGGTKNECELNPQCCFSENPRISGDPVCYHRGGAESMALSGAISTDEAMCASINIAARKQCFDASNQFAKVLNKVATRDQCEMAGCCFDANAAAANSEFGQLLGGDMDLTGPHCFKNSARDAMDSTEQAATAANLQLSFKPSDLLKTCDDTKSSANPNWPQLLQNRWVKDADGGWKYDTAGAETRPAKREQCDTTGDMHQCVYKLGCCFEKSADPREPWCYKPRYVQKPSVAAPPPAPAAP
jgi:hypothetical protein